MKRVLLILGVVLTMSCGVMAQDKKECEAKCSAHKNRTEWFQQMRTKKLVFLSNAMELTDTEKVAFAVLFEEHEAEVAECYKKIRVAKHSLNEESTEVDYKNAVEVTRIETLKIAEMRAKYLESLEKIMPAKKIYKLCEAEDAYKKLLISDMSKCKRVEKK